MRMPINIGDLKALEACQYRQETCSEGLPAKGCPNDLGKRQKHCFDSTKEEEAPHTAICRFACEEGSRLRDVTVHEGVQPPKVVISMLTVQGSWSEVLWRPLKRSQRSSLSILQEGYSVCKLLPGAIQATNDTNDR